MNRFMRVLTLGVFIAIGMISVNMNEDSVSAATTAQSKIKVMIDGKAVSLEKPPIVIGGTTFVPLRGIYEKLGIDVKWDSSTRTVTATKYANKVEYTIGYSWAKINEYTYLNLSEPGQVIGGTTMIPLRFVGESFGADVRWDSSTKTVSISTEEKLLATMSSEPTGNTNSNLNQNGVVVVQGDWIYGVEDPASQAQNGGYLYKSKLGGEDKVSLFPGNIVSSLNIQGDWLYFVSERDVYKMKTDGSSIEKLTEDQTVYKVYVMNDWLIYTNHDGIYRMRADGKRSLRVVQVANVEEISVSSGWIYYSFIATNKEGTYPTAIGRVRVDGSAAFIYDNDLGYYLKTMSVKGDYLYFIYLKKSEFILARQHVGDGNIEDLVTGASQMNLNGNTIYYISDDDRLYRRELDGEDAWNTAELPNAWAIQYFTFQGDRLYYYDNLIDSSNTEQGKLYSLDLKTKETKSVFGRTYFSGYNQAIIADKYGSDYSFINSKLADTYKKAKEIVQSTITSDMPEREKIRAVHDYVVLNAAYDYDNYKRGTIPDDSYSEYGILMLKTGVCEGYALTMQLLFNLAGIESYYLAGTANGGGHAWNVVKLDGKYYHLDATWDDPVPDRPGKTRYAYFLISDEQMAQDHKWDMESLNRLLGR